jgi:hypothetical protein
MPSNAIARHELRSERAYAFVNQFRANNSGLGDTSKDNHLYTMIGREDDPTGLKLNELTNGKWTLSGAYAAGDGIWGSGLYLTDDGNSDDEPPTATKSIQMANRFWATAIAAKKVTPSDIHLMIPRINWVTGTVYNVRPADGVVGNTWYDVNPPDNDFYILNSDEEVWLCVAKGADPGLGPPEIVATTSTIQPSLAAGGLTADTSYFRDGKTSIFGSPTTGDGYVWKYMFKLTATLINTLLLDDWIPVPCTNDSLWPTGSQTALLERDRGRDDAYSLLGARHVIIRSELTAGDAVSGLLPAGLRYRQVALVKNPCLAGTFTRAAAPIYYQANSINLVANQLEPFIGDIIYLENRSPITREENQTEEFKTIFVF